MLTKKAKYGIKALTYLCKRRDGLPVSIAEISQHENIPRKFLEAILLELKTAGILSAKKGKMGGYFLAQKPEEIYMSRILRLLNGPIAMVPCVSLNYYKKCDDCPDEIACGVNRLMLQVRDSVLAVLEKRTLKEVADKTFMEYL